MNVLYHTIWLIATTLIAGVSLSSCIYNDDTGPDKDDNIRIRTMAINGSRVARAGEKAEDRFAVMFWRNEDLGSLKSADADLPVPYLSQEAPQSVEFYSQTVYDTGYPYPYPETTLLYATGYAPAPVLTTEDNFRTLTVHETNPDKGRHDFLGCDLWPEVYKGSQSDPFAKDKNKLYFRHLAAKLKFYAARDRESMENKQFVRNVRITELKMCVDDASVEANWFAVHTPSQFKWSAMTDEDFTSSYQKTIDAVTKVPGNEEVTTKPQYGYHIYASEPFSCNKGFVFHRNSHDRVPISGMYVDSCYVCNPTVDGQLQYRQLQPIRFRMTISAEFSFHPDFPLSDGNNTDDLTFTRTWENVQTVIYPLDGNGNPITTGEGIKEFTPGKEYRVYVHFHRTGVNLAAVEMPWNPGGVHYITISGGDRQPAESGESTASGEPGNNNEPKN